MEPVQTQDIGCTPRLLHLPWLRLLHRHSQNFAEWHIVSIERRKDVIAVTYHRDVTAAYTVSTTGRKIKDILYRMQKVFPRGNSKAFMRRNTLFQNFGPPLGRISSYRVFEVDGRQDLKI